MGGPLCGATPRGEALTVSSEGIVLPLAVELAGAVCLRESKCEEPETVVIVWVVHHGCSRDALQEISDASSGHHSRCLGGTVEVDNMRAIGEDAMVPDGCTGTQHRDMVAGAGDCRQ